MDGPKSSLEIQNKLEIQKLSITQLAIPRSKLTIEILEQGVKYVQS